LFEELSVVLLDKLFQERFNGVIALGITPKDFIRNLGKKKLPES